MNFNDLAEIEEKMTKIVNIFKVFLAKIDLKAYLEI